MSFSQLRISSDILKGLKDVKIESPSPLHRKIIHSLKGGGDLMVKASNESMAETGYLVPILDHIARQDRRQGTKAIILTGDPERARELDKWIWGVGYHAEIESASVEDSGDRAVQKSSLAAGPTIIVATPERLAEMMEDNRMIFRETKFLILDRADRIESWDSVHVINKRIIGKCQHVVTLSENEENLQDEFDSILSDPQQIGFKKSVEKEETTGGNGITITKDLTQYYIKVPPRMKISTLMAHLESTPADTVLIFAASRRTADRLYRVFRKNGRRAVSLNSGLEESVFNERFDRFIKGTVQNLITGEISASSLPISQISQVINYDVPEDVMEYKLRADLVGDGKATKIVSLVSKQDRSDIGEIIEELGYAPREIPLPESVKNKKQSSERKSQKRAGHKRSGKKQGYKKPQQKQKRSSPAAARQKTAGLPRPSYDKLSGGRSGQKDREAGIVGFFKKLFT